MRAISLFDYTGNVLKPWAEAGYECHALDIQHPEGETALFNYTFEGRRSCPGSTTFWAWDAFEDCGEAAELCEGAAIVFAFPPCDHLAVSGARWFKGKGLKLLSDAIALVAKAAEVCEASGAPYLIENPVSTISTYWRKPDYTFHPYQYTEFCEGDNYTKKTCLWTGNGFVMPQAAIAELGEPDDRIHKAPPGEGRANFRSATPMGFARAVFEANR